MRAPRVLGYVFLALVLEPYGGQLPPRDPGRFPEIERRQHQEIQRQEQTERERAIERDRESNERRLKNLEKNEREDKK
jgi:hypothetical protein